MARTLLCLVFLTSAVASAAEGDGARFFQSGRTAFEAGDYAAALEAFEAALNEKFDKPALHFNIGVTAYRLGRYDRSERAFLEAARTPAMAALAHYNLGLVALGRGDEVAARAWFARCESETEDDRLRALASTQLGRLPAEPARAWTAFAAVNAGYDDNVALVSSSDVLGVSGTGDAFVEGQFVATLPIGDAWRFDAGAFSVRYRDLDQFDQIIAHGTARYRMSAGAWIGNAGVQLAHGTLGGDSFQNVATAIIEANTELPNAWLFLGRLRLSGVDGIDEFSGISGTRQEANAQVIRYFNDWRVSAGYKLENSNLRDDSLSSLRHELALGVERVLTPEWTVAGKLSYSRSRFDDGSDERRTELEASVSRVLLSNWLLVLRYAYADNSADRAEFEYERNQISLGIEVLL